MLWSNFSTKCPFESLGIVSSPDAVKLKKGHLLFKQVSETLSPFIYSFISPQEMFDHQLWRQYSHSAVKVLIHTVQVDYSVTVKVLH